MSITYHTTLPAWEHGELDERGCLRPTKGKLIWSNTNPPPAIGDRVRIRVNGIGMATVESYFEQEGYLGILTTVDAWPTFFAKQNGEDRSCHAFGAEIA
jgi:hypothetical protein